MKELGGFQFNNVLSSQFFKLCLDLLTLAKLSSVVNTGQYSKVMNTNGRDEDRPGMASVLMLQMTGTTQHLW